MKHALTFTVLAFALVLSGGPALAKKGHLKQCVDHAVDGPKKIEFRQISGHTFHCKPVALGKPKNGVVPVRGVLVHEHFGPDDHVVYTFSIENGKIAKDSLKKSTYYGVGPRDFLEGARKIVREIPIPYVPHLVQAKGTDEIARELDERVAGDWESVADDIIRRITEHVAKKERAATVKSAAN